MRPDTPAAAAVAQSQILKIFPAVYGLKPLASFVVIILFIFSFMGLVALGPILQWPFYRVISVT